MNVHTSNSRESNPIFVINTSIIIIGIEIRVCCSYYSGQVTQSDLHTGVWVESAFFRSMNPESGLEQRPIILNFSAAGFREESQFSTQTNADLVEVSLRFASAVLRYNFRREFALDTLNTPTLCLSLSHTLILKLFCSSIPVSLYISLSLSLWLSLSVCLFVSLPSPPLCLSVSLSPSLSTVSLSASPLSQLPIKLSFFVWCTYAACVY